MSENEVEHPAHYNQGKIEVIEFIEDQNLGFHLGSVIQYVCRAGKKDPHKEIEDLKKAIWYINRRVELVTAFKELRSPVRPNDMNKPVEIKVTPVTPPVLETSPRHVYKQVRENGRMVNRPFWVWDAKDFLKRAPEHPMCRSSILKTKKRQKITKGNER